jgi:hypothetical protein
VETFSRDDIQRFLGAMDEALTTDETLVLIGGGAIELYTSRPTRRTKDLDSWGSVSEALERAWLKAQEVTGLKLFLDRAGVADGPYNLDDRLVRTMPDLHRLTLMVPERHDLALMKIMRASPRDIVMVEDLHREHPLDYEVLMRRYDEEMSSVIGAPSRLQMHMMRLIERLFPEKVQEAERRLTRAHARWREILSPLPGPEGHRQRR